MGVGLKYGGKFACVPPGQAALRPIVFIDHDALDRCGEVKVKDEGNGEVSILFDEAQVQACVPDPPNPPNVETRPKGQVGPWEKFKLAADRKSISRAGKVLELVGYDVPQPAALHLEVRGADFVDASGKRIVFAGVDGFDDLWYRTSGRESELDALMAESRQLKAIVRRIWCMGDAGENQVFSMYPQNIPGYFDMLRGLVAYENGYGCIPLFTAFVDAQRVMPPEQRVAFWNQLHDALYGSGLYMVSAWNQWSKNGGNKGVGPRDLPNPGRGIVWSRGSDVDDTQTPCDGNGGRAVASELHATRNSFERALMDATASPPNMRAVNGATMVWMTEGNPFGDGGAYTAEQAWKLGRGYSIEWALAVHHNRQSQRGQLMQDATARSFEQFERGTRLCA